jgi:N-acetyl-anhydromuramyl-L-alanine amidase AmpD
MVPVIGLPIGFLALWLACRSHPMPVAPSGNQSAWMPEHPSNRWECIVIHHSASDVGGAARFDQWHRAKGWDELGYHFVIGNGSDTGDGQIEVGPRWREQKHGAHCKTPDEYYNQHGIGICLVGNFDDYDPSPAQLASLAALCRFLCKQFNIPPSHIYTHGGVTGKTDCPGKLFDVGALRRELTAPQVTASTDFR